MRVLFVPASGSWSFAPQAPPASWAIPVGGDSGLLFLLATTAGSTPVNGEGVVFTVVLDGGVPYVSACMENGQDVVVIPPGTTSIEVTAVKGCNAGPDTTDALVWAVSDT